MPSAKNQLSVNRLSDYQKSSPLVKIGEAAKILGVSIDTLRRWEKSGKISAIRTLGGTRLYRLETLENVNQTNNTSITNEEIPTLNFLDPNFDPNKEIVLSQPPPTSLRPKPLTRLPTSHPPPPATLSPFLKIIKNLCKPGKNGRRIYAGLALSLIITVIITIILIFSYLLNSEGTKQFFALKPPKQNFAAPHLLAQQKVDIKGVAIKGVTDGAVKERGVTRRENDMVVRGDASRGAPPGRGWRAAGPRTFWVSFQLPKLQLPQLALPLLPSISLPTSHFSLPTLNFKPLAQTLLSPFNALAQKTIQTFLPQKAQEIGLLSPSSPPQALTSKTAANLSRPTNVLGEETSGSYLEINADTTIKGALSIAKEINGITFSATDSGMILTDPKTGRSLTITGTDITLDQNLLTSASPTLSGLNLTASKNQLIFSTGTTGTLTWTPTSSSKTLTLPDITDTLITKTSTDTLSNKTIKSGDSNTISGSYPDISGITSLGTVSTGTWNGTKIGISYGGTNLTGYTKGDILYASATDTLAKLGIGTSGQSLIVSSGLPAWGSATATGVTALDSLTGALTLSNSSGSGTTITIDDATTAAKGIASFSSSFFSVSSGAVSIAGNSIGNTELAYDTGQALTTSSTPTFAGLYAVGGNIGIGTTVLGSTTALSVMGGNVGIGTTTPGTTGKLTLVGGGTAGGFNFRVQDSAGADKLLVLDNGNVGIGTTNPGNLLTISGGNVGIGTTAFVNGRLSIMGGNVGIGTTDPTTSGYNLSVVGTGNFTGSLTVAGSLITTGSQAGFWTRSGTTLYPTTATDTVSTLGNVGVGTTSPITLLDVNSKLNVQSGGNVGVGTTAPTAKLEVAGLSLMAPTSGSGTALTVRAAPTGSSNIFDVTNNAGTSSYFSVDSSGKMSSSAFQLTDASNAVVGTAIEGAWTLNSNTYTYRRSLTITNLDSGAALPQNYEVQVSISGSAASQIYSKSQSNGNDFRVSYNSTEIARNISTFSSSSIVFTIKLQAQIAASGTDASYYLYYRNSTLSAGSTFTSNQTSIDSGDSTSANWTSSQAGYPIADESTIKPTYAPDGSAEGTGSIKEGATTAQTGTPGTIGTESILTFTEGPLATVNKTNTTTTATIGGTTYIYVLGGCTTTITVGCSSPLSTAYKATINSSGDIGSFATTSQGQLPAANSLLTSATATIGGTNYVYVLGGYFGGSSRSVVYKATIDSSGNIGTFDTTSQGQLPQALYAHTTVTTTIGGTNYVYVLGGYGAASRSTVYKATIDSSGNIGAFDTTSQGQLPQTLDSHTTVTTTIGGTNYVYVLGGSSNGIYKSTVYKATIDSSGNIGTFATTSQGQLPNNVLFGHTSVIATTGGTSYIYVLGGGKSSPATYYSTVYKATIDSSGNIGTFATTSQGQLPQVLILHTTVTTTIGGTNYVYVLGGASTYNGAPISTIYKSTLDSSGNAGTFATGGNNPMATNLYRQTSHTATIGGTIYTYLLGGNSSSSALSTVYQTTVDSTGTVGTFATTSQAQLPVTLQQHTSELLTLGGTNYVYVLGGNNGTSAVSTAYQASISSGNLGTFATTSQAQLPATLQEEASTNLTIGGTTYVYVLGGYNGTAGVSTVYKSTISSTNLGAFSTTSQGQLPAALYRHSAASTSIAGTSYVYVLGGYNGTSAVSTVYKATVDSSGNLGSFATTSQGQLPAALYNSQIFVDTGSIYVSGGTANGTSAVSTVYKASIDDAGNIGTFSTTSQGQLGASLFGGSVIVPAVSNVPYFSYIGGYTGSAAVSTVYKAQVSPTYTATRTFTSALDWSNKNGLQWYFYSSRTGSYMALEYSNDGATYSTCSFSVSSASTWELKTCDLSGVANGSKNTIQKVRLRVTDTSSAFTSYFDNLWAMSTNFSGTTIPSNSTSSGNAALGASNLAINAQGTGLVQINYDATNGLAGTGGMAVYNGSSTPWFAVDSGGNVGIGTTLASARLQVLGGGTGAGFNFRLQDSSGADKLLVMDNGNVGIGTTNPGNLLTINGNVGIGTTAFANGRLSIMGGNVGIGTTTAGTTGKLVLVGGGTGAGFNLRVQDSSLADKFLILDNGNVGIGTTNPGNLLTVSGGNVGIGTTAFVNAALSVMGGNIGIGTTTAGTTAKLVLVGGGTGAGFNFRVQDSALADKFLIMDNGNVGIGTTNPGNLLTVSGGNVGIGTTATINGALSVMGGNVGIGTTNPTTSGYNLSVVGTGNFSGNLSVGTVNGNTITTGTGTLTLAAGKTASFADAFSTSGAYSLTLTTTGTTNVTLPTTGTLSTLAGTETFSNKTFSGNTIFPGPGIWDTNGNVGIGTTTPGTNTRLSILGGNVGIGTTQPSAPLEVKGSGTGAVIAKFTDTNTTGCTLAIDGTISCSSDVNLKKNITDLDYGLDSLMRLHPVSFNWKSQADQTAKNLGFIAQEVEAIIPKLVTTDAETGFKELNTIGLIPVLTRSIQEQQGQLDSLSGQVLSIMGNELPPPLPALPPDSELITQNSLLDLQTEIASLSARLAKLEISSVASTSANLLVESSSSALPAGRQATLADLIAQSATSSANIATLSKLNILDTLDAQTIKALDTTFSGTLKSLGQTYLGKTTIAGDFSVDGTLTLTGNSLSTLGTLSNQKGPLAELVDFFNGKVTIDKEGTVTLEKLAVSEKNLGTAKIPAGKTKIIISGDQIKENSKVFLTPHKPVAIAVTQTDPLAQTFTVELDSVKTYDLNFDWWIVDTR